MNRLDSLRQLRSLNAFTTSHLWQVWPYFAVSFCRCSRELRRQQTGYLIRKPGSVIACKMDTFEAVVGKRSLNKPLSIICI